MPHTGETAENGIDRYPCPHGVPVWWGDQQSERWMVYISLCRKIGQGEGGEARLGCGFQFSIGQSGKVMLEQKLKRWGWEICRIMGEEDPRQRTEQAARSCGGYSWVRPGQGEERIGRWNLRCVWWGHLVEAPEGHTGKTWALPKVQESWAEEGKGRT